mmetsp:Transcript_66793/g.186363  ORF Transcript_66793/g.186363 Transcript_66793/m.186363 type:complete len:378 (-) Transcript_66793:105-1238(-)
MSSVYLEHRDAHHVLGARSLEEVDTGLARAAEAILGCDALLFTAGAGMGVDSGLPDFRGTTGLWSDRDVAMTYEEMSNDKWFFEDPAFAWGVNYTQIEMYRTTAAHDGYATLLKWATTLGKSWFVFTSNIDGMFEKAGFAAEKVVACHGDMHHLQCTKDFRECPSVNEDRSDEVWTADCIPSGLGSEIDPAVLRFRDPAILEASYFRCPRCGRLARPNVWFCADKHYVPRQSACALRDVYLKWLWALQERGARLVVVECGGGLAIPSVRVEGEDAVEGCGEASLLVRINPSDCKVPAEKAVGLPFGALEGLRRIDAALEALTSPAQATTVQRQGVARRASRSPTAKSRARASSPSAPRAKSRAASPAAAKAKAKSRA